MEKKIQNVAILKVQSAKYILFRYFLINIILYITEEVGPYLAKFNFKFGRRSRCVRIGTEIEDSSAVVIKNPIELAAEGALVLANG